MVHTPAMAQLSVISGPQPGVLLPVEDGAIIGRSSSADLQLECPSLSRHHARLTLQEGRWNIADLRSVNGTFVNDVRVQTPAPLADGDEIRLGEVRLRFIAPRQGAMLFRGDITLVEERQRAPILDNVSADEQIEHLLPAGIEEEAVQLMIRRLRQLSEVAETLGDVIEVEKIFPKVLEKLLEMFPAAERGCILVCAPDGSDPQAVAALARPGGQRQFSVSRSLAKEVAATRSAVLSSDVSGDQRFDPQHTLVRIGLRTVMCAPMICEDTVLGLIQLDSSNPKTRFSKADMALFLGVAGHAALAVGKARLHEQLSAQMILQHDLRMAERIQHSFLPKAAPTIPGCRFAVSYSAARHIGGDYYDFLRIADDVLGVSVADVSGKGVSAALYMAKLSSEMRFHARGCLSPGAVLQRLNRSLAEEMEAGMFVTLALLVIEPSHRRLTIASAGHPPPLVRSAGGSVSELKAPRNLPLGVIDDTAFSEISYALQPGDKVLLYTDGVTEAMDPAGRMFGIERLAQVVAGGGEHPRELLAAVERALMEFTAGNPPSDDRAMVCLEVE